MKKTMFTLLLLVFGLSAVMAQRSISGTIVDANSEPLIGASVLIQGTSTGTVSDENGAFQLNVPNEGAVLVISYTGYVTNTIPVGASNTLSVILEQDQRMLNEVVITALGTEGNARSVVYSNQTVNSDDLLSSPNNNTLQALRGKAAGVKITTGSGSVGASSRIVLRGEGSLTGDNNALIVIDGIPVDNSSSRGGSGTAQDGYSDYGNRFNDLNPDDIESVTILKGPSATSLYGSRGASGVVLVTTKRGGDGKDGKIEIGLNSSFSVEKVYLQLKRQDRFGQGYDNLHFDSGENWSWGPEFDGVSRPWTSPVDVDGDGATEALVRPYSAVPDQIENFFNTGSTLNNSIHLSGAKGGFTYYASYSNLSQKGILENTDYLRNTLNFKGSAQLTKRLSSTFGVNYSNIALNTAQEGYRPFEGQNAYANAIQAPVNIPYNELRDYNSPFHNLEGYYGSYSTNPYYILNEYTNDGRINNFLGSYAMTYNLFKGFNLIGNVGLNYVNRVIETGVPIFAYTDHLVWVDDLALTNRGGRHQSIGEYSKTNSSSTNFDGKLLGDYSTDLNEDFSLNVTGGVNLFDRRAQSVTGITVGGMVVPDWYHLDNSVQTARASQVSSKYRLIGLLGNAKVGWKDRLFLEYSARNDWSSTLPADNNSFFYQAVGASAIVSDFMNLDNERALSYLKLRASIGTTGKDAPLYLLNSTFVGNPTIQALNNHDIFTPLNGQPGFTLDNQIGNPNLRPELTTTFEVGADISFLSSRVNLEYTYYQSTHSDQIIQISLPATTGYTSTYGNIGEMVNKGHELALRLKPIAGLVRGLTWDVDFLFAKNTNEVTKVSDEQDEIIIGGPFTNGSVSIVAKTGLPFGTFRSTVVSKTPTGQTIVDQTGVPLLTTEEFYLGSYQPNYTMSFGTGIGFAGFTISALLDVRKGGKFLSITKNQTEFNGTALSTLIGDREDFVIENSVVDNGDGTYSENTVTTNAQALYAVSDIYFGGESIILDASFVKLREVTLNYDLSRLIKNDKKVLSRANIGVYGSNLKFWLPEENTYADPEVNGPSLTGNATGVETTQTPTARGFGVRLGLTF